MAKSILLMCCDSCSPKLAAGIKADLDHSARSMKAQFKYANKLGVKKVIVIAGDELEKGVVKLRDMENSTEAEIARAEIISALK